MAITVGANLTPFRGRVAKDLSVAINKLFRFIEAQDPTNKTLLAGLPAVKLFEKSGAPVTNTAADSPGSDMCFVWDSSSLDLYIIHTWASSTSFTALKIID